MKLAANITRLMIIPILISGCAPQPAEDPHTELLEAIDSFYAAVESGDADARIGLFSDDAVMMPNHWKLWLGKETIAEVIRGGEGHVFKLRDREVIDMHSSGDLAYTVNSYYYTYHPVGEEPQWHKTKNVHIWRKNPSGEWKLHVDIWNSDVPMEAFADE